MDKIKVLSLIAKSEQIFNNRFARTLFCLTVIAVVFCWATITPPFQSPDEIAHFYRTQSIRLDPWNVDGTLIKVANSINNPLVYAEGLNKLPFRAANQLNSGEVIGLRRFPWPQVSDQSGYILYHSTAAQYPPLYYGLLLLIAEPLKDLLNLAPYESFYIYRYVSILLALFLWGVVIVRLKLILKKPELAYSMVALILLVPMNAFITASINPDVIFNPLSAWLFIEVYRGVIFSERKSQFLSGILAAAILLVKPTAVFVLIAFGFTFFFAMLFSKQFKGGVVTALFTLIGAAVGYFSFYPYVQNGIAGGGAEQTLYSYLENFYDKRFDYLSEQFWGTFGWLDFKLGKDTISKLGLLTKINLVLALIFGLSRRFVLTGLFSFISFTAVLLLMEYYIITNSSFGLLLQGRYIAPAMLGFTAIVYHKVFPLRWYLLISLLLANFEGYHESIWRYYANDKLKVMAALPFSNDSIDLLTSRKVLERKITLNPALKWNYFKGNYKGHIEAARKDGTQVVLIGWILLPDSQPDPNIFIGVPVSPLNITQERTERGDIRRKYGSEFGFSGFNIILNFSTEEKAQIAAANFCLAVSDGDQNYGIEVSKKNGSCKSKWRP